MEFTRCYIPTGRCHFVPYLSSFSALFVLGIYSDFIVSREPPWLTGLT